MHQIPISQSMIPSQLQKVKETENNKLINVVYHEGEYYIHEPNGDKKVVRDPDLIIEKHIWTVLKFLPKSRQQIFVNDIVRFGRVTFKVTELVITPDEIEQTALAIEALQNGRFKVGENLRSDVDLNSSMPDLAQSL